MSSDEHDSKNKRWSGLNGRGAEAMDRRTFLTLAGFTFAGATISGCQRSRVEQAIPLLVQPEEITPGLAAWYTTTCNGCSAGCGMMAKNRDGRPIKLEGNPDHPLSKGGLCAIGQACLLPLYDSQRLTAPTVRGVRTGWQDLDRSMASDLDAIRRKGGTVRVLTGTVTSPTTKEMIRRFVEGFRDGRHVMYDSLSSSAILDAHEQTHAVRALPRYRFDNAEVIVGFDADFLGTWLSPVEFTAGYRAGRSLSGSPPCFSYHVQVESRLSLTGSKADRRISRSPEGTRSMLLQLASHVERRAGVRSVLLSAPLDDRDVSEIADRLWDTKQESLVISGLNDLPSQILVNYMNHLLGNYGATVDIERPSYQRQGSDRDLWRLIGELKSGSVDALFVQGTNPVYDVPGHGFAGLLEKVPLVVCFTDSMNETAAVTPVVCPEPHMLERWDDSEPVAGVASLAQPVIRPFGETRTMAECLSAWLGHPQSALEIIRGEWNRNIYRRQSAHHEFEPFWDEAVQKGWVEVAHTGSSPKAFDVASVRAAVPDAHPLPGNGAFDLVLYPAIAMMDGRHAHNPWLQELPDPISKIAWDNFVSISPAAAGRLGIEEEDEVRLESGGSSIEMPAHIQPGQHENTLAVALGYGRKGTDRFTNIGPQWLEAEPTVPEGGLVGKNAAPFLRLDEHALHYDRTKVTLVKTGRRLRLASAQTQQSLDPPSYLPGHTEPRRPIVQESTFADWSKSPAPGTVEKTAPASLWPDEHAYAGHRWGLVIDLTACTGCSACVVSCAAENNTPLVGKDEIRRNRGLSWIRVDRYCSGENDGITVAYQPMMCQHCGNAPCETVCPVLATVHSEEGLNQQVYNRCVGTRYCSNNCPYKVRRFNWFAYDRGDDVQRLALNPDVVVRERGVMEKCSFCVQRIQEAKIAAKNRGVALSDGDVQPACAQSCPAHAIVFGDMNDQQSAVSMLKVDRRYYRVLEETGVEPSVGYLSLIRNRPERGDDHA